MQILSNLDLFMHMFYMYKMYVCVCVFLHYIHAYTYADKWGLCFNEAR